MDQRTKRALWIVAGVVVFVALVAHHNITTQEIIIFCVLVPSIILHEISHGWVANAFGDDTAKRAGRLTPQPGRRTSTRSGTLIVPALLSLGGVGVFGWAKPVPVNVGRLRSPRNQGVLVSLAGPAVNAVLAAIFAVVFVQFVRPGLSLLSRARSRLGAQVVFYAEPGQRRALRLQPDPGAAARRLRPLRAAPAGALLADLSALPPVHDADPARDRAAQLLPVPRHGPITWLFDQLYTWWGSVLGI